MTPLFATLGVVGAAALTALATWLVAKRSSSGRIDTSSATDLWKESSAIRKDLRDDNVRLSDRLAAVEAEAAKCKAESMALQARIADLEQQIGQRRRTHE